MAACSEFVSFLLFVPWLCLLAFCGSLGQTAPDDLSLLSGNREHKKHDKSNTKNKIKTLVHRKAIYVHQLVPSVDAKVQFCDHVWGAGCSLVSTYLPQ
jgi:hypothetical protein